MQKLELYRYIAYSAYNDAKSRAAKHFLGVHDRITSELCVHIVDRIQNVGLILRKLECRAELCPNYMAARYSSPLTIFRIVSYRGIITESYSSARLFRLASVSGEDPPLLYIVHLRFFCINPCNHSILVTIE